MFITDLYAQHFAVDVGARGVQVFGLDGEAAGPVIDTGFRSAFDGAISPLHGRLFVSSFDRGTIKCFDWRTGEMVWCRQDAFRQISQMHCFGPDRLVVGQLRGALRTLDQATGEELSSAAGARSFECTSRGGWIAVIRQGPARSVLPNRIEFYQGLESAPVCAFETAAEGFSASLSESHAVVQFANNVMKRFDLARGLELWKHDFGSERAPIGGVIEPVGSGIVFTVVNNADEPRQPAALVIDPETGKHLGETPLEWHLGHYLDGGRAAVTPQACVRIPELIRTPFARAVR